MTVKIKSYFVPGLGVAQDDAIEYNPNRIKLILTTDYDLDDPQYALLLYRPPWEGINQTMRFPIWGLMNAAGEGATPAYLHLNGEMAHGPYGVINLSVGVHMFYILEEIKETPNGEPSEAPGMNEEEPEKKPRGWWPFRW